MRTVDEIREKMDELAIENEASVFEVFEKVCEKIDEDPDAMSEEFDALSKDVISAVDVYINTIFNLEREIKIAKQMELHWKKQGSQLKEQFDTYKENMIKRLKYGSRYVGHTGSIRLAKSKPEVKVLNEETIPDEFKDFVTTFKINKPALREYLLGGNTVEGATIRHQVHIMKMKS